MNGCNVGVELEVENYHGYDAPAAWKVVGEAMLLNGAEFVLRKPLSGDKLVAAVTGLCKGLTTETFTQRCSTHIHIDVRELNHLERMKFITAYVIFEPLLLSLIDPDRVGNVFCLPVSHSVGLEEALIKLSQNKIEFEDIGLGGYKYGAMNIASVNNLGSLEFRALHGTGSAKEILNWIELHTLIKKYAMSYEGSPADMLTDVSAKGCVGFAEEVFGDLTKQFRDIDWLVYSGVRSAQYFAFTGDW
tara:strand:- start:140 stop:877 length:738 start_codon:yes stop_codon:yes gene_type:complete